MPFFSGNSPYFRQIGRAIYDFLTFRSLLSRFWWALFLLSILSALSYAFIVDYVWIRYVDMRTQHAHWRVAAVVSKDIQQGLAKLPNKGGSDSEDFLNKQLQYYAALSPLYDIYIYQPETKTLRSSWGNWNGELDLKPIELFLNPRMDTELPITLKTNPFRGLEHKRRIVFSAAHLRLNNKPAYLIVILGGKRFIDASKLTQPQNISLLGFSLFASIVTITSVMGILVVLLLTRRFNRMIRVVNAFRAGDLSQRANDSSTDEMGIYARAFDEMADTIVDNIEDLQKQDHLRRELVANVSHELRRPVSLMNLSLETLVEGSSDSEQHKYLIQALNSCQDLSRLIDDLFELSKLNSEEKPIQIESCELDALAADLVAKFQKPARQKGIELKLEQCSSLPSVSADVALIDRALSNLIENALKYCSRSNTVSVCLKQSSDEVLVTVSDDGPGISREDMPHIFERFYRGEDGRTAEKSGAGLGLAITKRIIELHNKTISVTAISPSGTSFSFRLDANP